MNETNIQDRILVSLGGRIDVRIFRNNVGNAYHAPGP